jgi:hypothetical protein
MLNLLDRRIRVFSARPTIERMARVCRAAARATRVAMRSRGSVRASTRERGRGATHDPAPWCRASHGWRLGESSPIREILPAIAGKAISSADGVNLLPDRIRAFCREIALFC